MQKLVKNYLDEFNKRHKRNKRAAVALILLAVLVVGGVLSTLSQYGVAMEEPEKKPLCGLEEHTHTEECYEDVLICGYGEEAEAAEEAKQEPAAQEPAVQEQVERVLSCGQDEQEGHQHSDSCYETKRELTCGQEESEEHTHTDECYTEESVLACGNEEGEGAHTHTEDCYTETVVMVPVETAAPAEQKSSEEAAEKHTHTDACYEHRLVCGLEEHTHTEACYIDGAADVETASDWEEMFADVEWKEQWGEDLVTAAQMQIGYQESKTNYQSDEDGDHKGYTRYGAFMDDPYMDWNAAFVNFCMHYAGLCEEDVFPEETNAGEWYQTFVEADENNANYITLPEEYEPKAGDIVFLEDEENEETLMGIVSSYDEETGEAKVIAGDDGDEVTEETYVIKGEAADESPISSYLMTTELEDHIKNNTRIMKAEGEDYTVTVRFTDAAEIPDDAELNVREIEEGTDEYQTYYERSLEAVGAEKLSFARCFDVTFLVNGEEIEPKDTVNVTVSYKDSVEVDENSQLGVAHFKNDRETEILDVESNLNGDTAVTSEEKVGSGLEEETTGTFFRFNQNSFSGIMTFATSNSGDNAKASGTKYTFYKWSKIDASTELDGKIVLLTNFFSNDNGIRNRLMTANKSGNGLEATQISSGTTELSETLSNAWSFKKIREEENVRYYSLYNIGQEKYLKMSGDSSSTNGIGELKLVDEGEASQLIVKVEDECVIISTTNDTKTFRLDNSGSGTEFIAYYQNGVGGNEKLTLFKLQKTVVLNPYNISSEAEVGEYPYRFNVDGETNKRIRLPLTVDISLNNSNLNDKTATFILPDNDTRTKGFDISSADGSGSHYILDSSSGYKWRLKGWYNVAKNTEEEKRYCSAEKNWEATVSWDNSVPDVFYADWEADNYNIGQKDDSRLGGVIDTKSYNFIHTELFDYNELVNITLNKINSAFGKELVEQTETGEKWETKPGTNQLPSAFGNYYYGDSKSLGTSRIEGNQISLENGEDGAAAASKWKKFTPAEVLEIVGTLFEKNGGVGITYLGDADCLYKEENGYYMYDSDANAASYNKSDQRFYVYKGTQTINSNSHGGADNRAKSFVPLNGSESHYTQETGTINYWFGMKTEIDYWLDNPSDPDPDDLPPNLYNGEAMKFEFSGDDDVWVFDQVKSGNGWSEPELVLNLSGCHYKWEGSINFSTGEVQATGETSEEPKPERFKSGQHKLTVYYLERGAGLSNCMIKFNLIPAWEYAGQPMQKITVNKRWATPSNATSSNATPSNATPSNAEVSVSLFESDSTGNKTSSEATDTQTLSATNNWTYTWYKPLGKNYTVEESENDSYIMDSFKREIGSCGSWIEDSSMSAEDKKEDIKIVIGNGKADDSGRVLAVKDENIVSENRKALLNPNHDNNPDTLVNEDVTGDGTGIPLNQQWIVHITPSSTTDKGYSQFQLESAECGGYYLSIKETENGVVKEEPSLVKGANNGSTFYFDSVNGHLTGISTNRLVVDGEGFKVIPKSESGTSESLNDNRVHLYRYFSKDETKKSPLTTVTITNKSLMAKIQIEKVNRASKSTLLSQAVFKLYQKDKNGKEIVIAQNITTGNNGADLGIATIDPLLPVGTYYLEEMQPPVGYTILEKPIEIKVSKVNTGTDAKAKVEVNFNNAWADAKEGFETVEETEYLTYENGTFTIVVPNVPFYKLPSTGGIGTYWYTIGGTLLLMAAALVLYKRKYAGR